MLADRDYMAPKGSRRREEWESQGKVRANWKWEICPFRVLEPGMYAVLISEGRELRRVGPFGGEEELLRWYDGNWNYRDVEKIVVEEVN